MQCSYFVSRFQSAEGKEAARLVLDEVREIFCCCQGNILLREVLFAEPGLSKSDYVICFPWMVYDGRVFVFYFNFSSAAHRLCCQSRNVCNSLLYYVQSRTVVAANSSLHERRIREDIIGMTSLNMANRENEVLGAVNIAGLDRVESL